VPLSRVGPIAIVMTINLLAVEIARGDVATRAGSGTGVKLFLTQINRRESRISQRTCAHLRARAEAERKRGAAREMATSGRNPTRGIVSPTEVALFITRHFRRRARAVPVYGACTHRFLSLSLFLFLSTAHCQSFNGRIEKERARERERGRERERERVRMISLCFPRRNHLQFRSFVERSAFS